MRSGQFPDTPFERRLMAIYHLHARTGSRDGGQSAAATAAYLARIAAYGKTRHQVVHLETGHMPVWAVGQSPDRRSQIGFDYWLAADTYERANGRLFKEVEFALPIELKPDKRLALAREFALALTTDIDGGNLPFALSIHRGSSKTTPKLSFYANEDLNPHCHVLISERVNDGDERTPETWFKRHGQKQGGARKTDKLKPAEWLQQTRALWAEMCNRLERSGEEAQQAGYDCRHECRHCRPGCKSAMIGLDTNVPCPLSGARRSEAVAAGHTPDRVPDARRTRLCQHRFGGRNCVGPVRLLRGHP
jgi:hypothetical protein